jgi:IMP dehydrogenase
MIDHPIPERLTLDDILLLQARPLVLPKELETRARYTDHIELNISIVGGAKDTVTESHLGIAEARQCSRLERKPLPTRHHHKGASNYIFD